MDYHLHHMGRNVGTFPIEELCRKRNAGEISGQDLVWCEGMTDWATLDSVLQVHGLSTPAVSFPNMPRSKRHRLPAWGKVVLILGVLVGVAVTIGMTTKILQGFRQTVKEGELIGREDASDVVSKPVVVNAKALTQTDVSKRKGDFRFRQYVDGYRKNGRHTAAWDGDALQLIKSWIAINYGGPIGLPDPRILSDKIVARPDCDDPLIWLVAAANSIELHEATRRLEKATAGFEDSKYQAYPKFYANVYLATNLGKGSPRIRSLDASALRYLKESFVDGSFKAGDEEEIADIMITDWGRGFFDRNGTVICEMVSQTKADPWLALVLNGENEISEAWKERGGGYANTVTKEGWKGFARHLDKARLALTGAWKLHPGWRIAPSRMIYVSLGDGGIEEMKTWFDRTLEAQIDYPQAWHDMRWGLRPRWYGSHKALIDLGIRAVDTQRFDTDVPRILFDCITDVESEMELAPGKHIYGRTDIWPQLKRMYDGYLAEPSQAQWRDGWRSTYATIAYLAGDYTVAREQLEAVNWNPMAENLTAWGTDLSVMPLKVAALTGKSSKQVEAAEESYELRDYSEAMEGYTKLENASDTDEKTKQFSHSRLVALKQESLLAKGEWIDLMPSDDKDPNWAFCSGKVTRLPDGAVEVESGPAGHILYSRTRVGAEFEVKGEFEVVRSSTKDFQAGLVMGLPDSHRSPWYAFRMKRNATESDVMSFSRGWTLTAHAEEKAPLKNDRNTFTFRRQGQKIEASLNDAQVFRVNISTNGLQLNNDSMIGLGAFNDMNETIIRYRNVKVRRLAGAK